MWWWSPAVSAIVIAISVSAHAEAAAPQAEVATRVLSNGLRVVARADLRAPLIAIDVRYGVGESMDPPEQGGLVQGIARMLREGETRHLRRGEATRITDAARIEFASRNVFVTLDATH